MDKVRKGVNRIAVLGSFFVRQAWASIVLLLLAVIMIGSGFYLRSQPEWTLRADIREYNRGVSEYQLKLWAPLVSSEEMVLSVYPHVIEKAGASFDKTVSESTDKKLRSLSFYNLGTLIGRLAFFSMRLPGSTQWLEGQMAESVTKLGQAIRNDPNNEDAKFNLELLERVLAEEEKESGGPGRGYTPGAVDKGY